MLKNNEITILLLTVLLIASTFIGVPLNGGDKGWIYLNGPFIDFVAGRWLSTYSLLSILIIMWTIVLYLVPFFMDSTYRDKIVIIVPAVYLILTVISFLPLIILCIPFIVCWVILMRVVLRLK